MSQLSQRSLLQKLQGWSDERCKDDFEDIMPKLLREIVEASPEGTVELCSLLHKRFLCHALIDELGQKIMNTVSSELGNVFFKAIEKLPGCHRDVSTMTLATVTEGLKYSVEVLKCYDEFIRQVVSLVKESAAAIELPSMYEFSSCTIEILNKSYTHCKSSEKNYGEIFRQTSGILGLLFQKTYSMQKSFGFILANIKQTTEFVISDENKKSVEKISQGLLTVCETTCSIDNTLLASTWNIMIRFIKEFKDVVQEKINPNPYVSLLSENIIQCVSYSIQLHDKSFHLLTSGDEATKKALNQSSKYSKVLLSILLDMVKVFHVKLNNRSVCILMSFFHKFHHLFKLEESINCSVHTKIQFRCNFIKQLVQYQSIIRLLLSSSCFLPYFHVFSLEAGEFHYGWLHVWLSINNELVTSETVLFQWCLNPGDARSPAVLLVNFIIDCVSSINNVAHSHLNNGNALYETALIHVCALISQLPKDVFTNVENSMFHFLSSYNPVKSLFAGDVFAFLARSSPAIASHYKSVFCKMLCCVVDIEKIVFPLHLLISLLNRIGASLEDIQKMSSKSLNMFPKWSIVLKQSGDINISPRKICNDILNVVKRPKISLGDMHGLSANLSLLALCFKNSSIIRKEKALLKSAISSTLNIFEDFGSLDNLCLSITYNCFISRFLDALKHFMPLADEFEKTKALQCFQVMLTNNIAMPAQLQVAGILCELVDVSSENLGTMSNIFHKLITSHNWLVSHSSVVSLINVTQSANGTNLLEKCVTSSEISEIMEAYFAVDTEKADLYHLPLLKPGTDSMTEVVKYFQSWQDKASKQSECFIAKRTDPGNSSSLSQRISHIEDEMLLLSHSISDTVRSKGAVNAVDLQNLSSIKCVFDELLQQLNL